MTFYQLADGSPPDWTDKVSAVGTVGASVVTFIALFVTIRFAKRDRRRAELLRQADLAQAAVDRTEADRRLRDERLASDQRLRDERVDADRRQVRDWQAASTLALLERIAGFQAVLVDASDGVTQPARWQARSHALTALRAGGQSHALALGSPQGTTLYRNLVALAGTQERHLDALAETSGEQQIVDAVSKANDLDLRRYSRYVRLWLHQLIETGSIPDAAVGSYPGNPDLPVIDGADKRAPWVPILQPPGWKEDTNMDSDDPQFCPLP
ncbi:hypothetical protein ACWEQL_21670 [Kitasatospora sp. NPDC004240]